MRDRQRDAFRREPRGGGCVERVQDRNRGRGPNVCRICLDREVSV
jgi:hypothetical protein